MKASKHALRAMLVGGALLGASVPSAASADQADDSGELLGEVVVTAQKRAENVKDVPIAITAVSGERLGAMQITNFHDLTRIAPSFNSNQLGDARASGMNMRGVTSTQGNPGRQSSLGIFVDGVFMARTGMASSQDFLDIERVEVLRGPQGTLFGMNTAAGLVHIITRKPDLTRFGGYGEVVFGNYNLVEGRARVSGPIIPDTLGFSLSAGAKSRDGFTYNSTTKQDVDDERKFSVRGKLLYKKDNFDALLTADYARETTRCCNAVIYKLLPGANLGGVPTAPIAPSGLAYDRETLQSGVNTNPVRGNGLSAELNWYAGDHTITSLTASRFWTLQPLNDPDALPQRFLDNFLIDQGHRQFSQELRLTSPGDRKLTYVAGLFYYDRRSTDYEDIRLGPDAPAAYKIAGTNYATITDARVRDRTYSIFGHANYHWTDQFTTSVGVRYTYEPQSVVFNQTSNNRIYANLGATRDKRTDEAWTWKLDASYRWTPDVTTYGSIARGFKPGGFEITRRSNMIDFQFEPETNLNYEVGLKGYFLDRRLSMNLAAFYTEYDDFQTLAFNGTSYTTRNAEQFVTKGIEVEGEAHPIDGLWVTVAASYVDAAYTDFKNGTCRPGVAGVCDLSGKRLNGSAKYYFNAAARYERPVSENWRGFGMLDFSYKSSIYISQNLDPNTRRGGGGVFNGRVGIKSDEGLLMEAFATNLLNKDYMNFMFLAPLSVGTYVGYVGAPRVYGVRVSRSF